MPSNLFDGIFLYSAFMRYYSSAITIGGIWKYVVSVCQGFEGNCLSASGERCSH